MIETGWINRSPAEAGLALTHADLLWLRAEWLAACKVGPETRAGYEQKTRYFVQWWQDYGETADWRLTERHLIKFEEWLCLRISQQTRQPLAWHTRHDSLRRLAEMLKWATELGHIEGVDCCAWIPVATGEAPERRAADVSQLWRLMEAAGESKYPLRDQTILAFFIGTGVRLAELTRLEAQQMVICADGSGTAAITGKRTRANKSGRRKIAFDAFTGRYLLTYLDAMMISEGPLFFNDQTGLPLKRAGIYRMVKRTVKAAGLADKIQGPHDLRRAFSTILALHDSDDPIFADMIRRQLGHKHYSQTAEYTKIEAEHIRERIVSPLALARPKSEDSSI